MKKNSQKYRDVIPERAKLQQSMVVGKICLTYEL